MCFESIVKSSKERAQNLSQIARELLYLISLYHAKYPGSIETSELYRLYNIFFSREVTRQEFDKALDELIGCYIIQEVSSGYIHLPPYLSELLDELREFMPEVEVKVSWKIEHF